MGSSVVLDTTDIHGTDQNSLIIQNIPQNKESQTSWEWHEGE